MELKGKTAIVTGAGRGIGEGIARGLAREGASVIALDMNLDDAKKVVSDIEANGGRGLAQGNVTKRPELDALVADAVKQFGGVDILVDNAGIQSPPSSVKDMREEDWDRVLAVNLKGAVLCCQAVIPAMIARKGGAIVNISSAAANRMTFFGSANYTASKYGLGGFSHHLAWELAEHRIRVNEVLPGYVLTPLMEQNSTPELRERITRRFIPLGRFCTPDDIASAVVFLASDRAALITGIKLTVDGGVSIGWGEDVRALIKERPAGAHGP